MNIYLPYSFYKRAKDYFILTCNDTRLNIFSLMHLLFYYRQRKLTIEANVGFSWF